MLGSHHNRHKRQVERLLTEADASIGDAEASLMAEPCGCSGALSSLGRANSALSAATAHLNSLEAGKGAFDSRFRETSARYKSMAGSFRTLCLCAPKEDAWARFRSRARAGGLRAK